MRKSIIWIPVLFVGSMVYWTLAVGLGGLSLVGATADTVPYRGSVIESAAAGTGVQDTTFQSITVKLGDSLELTDQPGGSVTVDLVSDHQSAGDEEDESTRNAPDDVDLRGSGKRSRTDRGPGETAF
ncbi:MAG: hypothetical protein ABJA82_04345 [Myxococcales bacterium]